MEKLYKLPSLPYGLSELEPLISEQQLKLHYEKHHQKYVDDANSILKQMESARDTGTELDVKSTLKSLSFNVGGHILHSLMWENLAPEDKSTAPGEELQSAIIEEFGSVQRFKEEFSKAALSVEGSGWAALTYCKKTGRLLLMQIEKHNVNIYPMFTILLVLDVWEHAYYLDYQNRRTDFIDSFWKIVNWREVDKRFHEVMV